MGHDGLAQLKRGRLMIVGDNKEGKRNGPEDGDGLNDRNNCLDDSFPACDGRPLYYRHSIERNVSQSDAADSVSRFYLFTFTFSPYCFTV